MKVAVVQHDIVWEDRRATLERLENELIAAKVTGARLIAFTEMFAVGFSMNVDVTAEAQDGPTVTWMRSAAVEHDAWVAGSVPLLAPPDAADTERPTNAMIVAGPGGQLHRYDKVHPFSYAGEDAVFQPGGSSVIVDIEGVRFGLSVCYDLRFADMYWQRAGDVDAELIVANWPAARRNHWRTLIDARAIENQVFMVAANRVGVGGGLTYSGDSRIVDPMGDVLCTAAHHEVILTADVDPAVVRHTREQFPFQADRVHGTVA